jgi:predicted AAA+ superfamily ATPase
MTNLFSPAEVLRVLNGFNPWWAHRKVTVPEFRRPVYDACRKHLTQNHSESVLLLSGIRGSGKSTMLLQLAQDLVASGTDPRSVLYLSVEHPMFGMLPLAEILRIYREMIHPLDRHAVLLLDELHYAKEWDSQVKELLYGENDYRIIATESVQMIERALVTETQVGRWTSIAVPSLSFYEYLKLRGLDPGADGATPDLDDLFTMKEDGLAAVSGALKPLVPLFPHYLTGGGLPGLAPVADASAGSSLFHEDAAERILRRAIARHFAARNVEDLKRLFLYLCVHSGDIFRVQRYAQALGVSPSTVANHVELLERCFLVRRIPPSGPGGTDVQKARNRVFVADATLRNVPLLRDPDGLGDPEERRTVVATAMLRHVAGRYARGLERLTYWRDARGRGEIDAVVWGDQRPVVFTLTADSIKPFGFGDPVVDFCRRERVARAFLVSADNRPLGVARFPGVETAFLRIPAHVLTYFLGRAECETWKKGPEPRSAAS